MHSFVAPALFRIIIIRNNTQACNL